MSGDSDSQPNSEETLDAPIESAQPPSPELRRIRYVGDYELISEIARGGMGIVYRAKQLSLNRIVAVKIIRQAEYATELDRLRFRSEAEAAANLDRPNIVPIYEVGEHDGQPYFSMRLIEGGSLADSIRKGRWPIDKPDTLQRAAKLVATVARAVHAAHQYGILHRDLKPGNILLDASETPSAKSALRSNQKNVTPPPWKWRKISNAGAGAKRSERGRSPSLKHSGGGGSGILKN